MTTPREVIMRALSDPLEPVLHGYAPRCMAIERALDAAGFVIVPKSAWFRPADDGKPNDVQ